MWLGINQGAKLIIFMKKNTKNGEKPFQQRLRREKSM